MEEGGRERVQVLRNPLTPSARRKKPPAIRRPKERQGEGWRVKSRVEEQESVMSADKPEAEIIEEGAGKQKRATKRGKRMAGSRAQGRKKRKKRNAEALL